MPGPAWSGASLECQAVTPLPPLNLSHFEVSLTKQPYAHYQPQICSSTCLHLFIGFKTFACGGFLCWWRWWSFVFLVREGRGAAIFSGRPEGPSPDRRGGKDHFWGLVCPATALLPSLCLVCQKNARGRIEDSTKPPPAALAPAPALEQSKLYGDDAGLPGSQLPCSRVGDPVR